MKGFLGTFFVFILWTFSCIYFVSTRPSYREHSGQEVFKKDTLKNNPIQSTTGVKSTFSLTTPIDNEDFQIIPDSLSFNGIKQESSLLLAEEIHKAIAISDTVDITKNEPVLAFEKELATYFNTSCSSTNFYPHYNNADLILDKELIIYATKLKKLLIDNPEKKITILGHTDNIGNSQDNFDLALKMSRQVKWYLTTIKGIPRNKITATSRGEEDPITDNKDSTNRKKNNRVQIIVY